MEKEFEYEGYKGTVNYDKNCDYYTGEVVIDDAFTHTRVTLSRNSGKILKT